MFELNNISAGYRGATVLWDVSLTIPDASTVALIGPNGAGKTTLLRVASGLLRSSAGTVELDGKDLTGRGPHRMARRGVCHVPEGRAIFPSLTVRENLVLFSPRRSERESIEKACDAFAILGQRINQVAGTLSGGEQQMLAIVRAYLTDPRLILVDEASMGLAPLVVDGIYEFMQKIAAQGTALLLVEQYVQRALGLAQHVYVLGRGRITYSGPSAGLDQDVILEQYLGRAESQ